MRVGDTVVGWWVARLAPNRLTLACGCLAQLGYETYAPRVIEKRTNHGRRIEVATSLFPGYCFVMVTATGQWRAAGLAPGVRHIVCTGFVPSVMQDDVIESIRMRERDGLVELPERQPLKPGMPVRLVAGPFFGRLGIYDGMNGHERVAVLLHVLGAHQRVTLPAADVEPAG